MKKIRRSNSLGDIDSVVYHGLGIEEFKNSMKEKGHVPHCKKPHDQDCPLCEREFNSQGCCRRKLFGSDQFCVGLGNTLIQISLITLMIN